MNSFDVSPQEKAFHQLHVIANTMRDVLAREYNVAVIIDSDGVKKLCFLGEKVTTYMFGCAIHSRKRYALPVDEVIKKMMDFSLENGYKSEVFREADECLNKILSKGIGPLYLCRSRFGAQSAYRALCALAEEKLAH